LNASFGVFQVLAVSQLPRSRRSLSVQKADCNTISLTVSLGGRRLGFIFDIRKTLPEIVFVLFWTVRS